MDPASLAVFTTLGINIIGTLLIFFGWLILRKCRGDKRVPSTAHHRLSGRESIRVSTIS